MITIYVKRIRSYMHGFLRYRNNKVIIIIINKVVNHGKQQLIETLFLTLWMNLILLTYIDNYTQEPNPLLTSQKP